jgi:PAS domain-containing protein
MKHFPQPATTSMEYGAPPRSFVADFRAALLNTPYQGISVAKVKPKFRTRIRYLAVLWTVGVVLMISATWLMVWLAIFNHPETAILVYLLIITLLSSMDSFLTSVVFSVIAVVCLSYFFKEPRYSFEVAGAQDLIALFTFVGTSLAIATLVRRARQFGEAQHEQATLLELTPDAIFALDTHRVITYWNRGAERLFGWSKDEAIGKPAHLLLKAVYPTPFHEIGEKSNRTGQ